MAPNKTRSAKGNGRAALIRKAPQKAASSISESSVTTSSDLPNEILSKILFWCDEDTLLNALLVSHRWHSVINETVGFHVSIGSSTFTTTVREKVRFHSTQVIQRYGIRSCYVGELSDVPTCPFKYPQTVREIVFDGPITNSNLLTLLAPLPTLTHLTIHYAALEVAKLDRSSLRSGSLKSLRIASHLTPQSYPRSTGAIVIQNLITLFLSIHSQHLESLILDLVFIPSCERPLTKSILAVLVRHKRTLKYFQCYNTPSVQEPEPDPPGTESSRAEIHELPLAREEIVREALKEAINIKRISYAGLRDTESDVIWNLFIVAQKGLQELFYMNDNRNLRTTGLACLKTNASSLRKLLFHVNATDESRSTTAFDCATFKSFPNLTHLLIRGRQLVYRSVIDVEANIARVTLKIPILKNVYQLPHTIQVLSLRDIYVDFEHLSSFQAWIPSKLRKIRLVDTGTFANYGLKPETFLDMLGCVELKEIEIIRSFNKAAWDNAMGKDIYEEALFYKVKAQQWHFHVKRNEEGIFHYKDGPMFDYGQSENTLRANDVCQVVFQ